MKPKQPDREPVNRALNETAGPNSSFPEGLVDKCGLPPRGDLHWFLDTGQLFKWTARSDNKWMYDVRRSLVDLCPCSLR